MCAACLAVPVLGQNTLTVHQKNGEKFSFGFEDKPVVSFTDNEFVATSTKTELRFELAKVAKFTFDKVEDSVIEIKDDSAKSLITLDEYTVSISGAKPNVTVLLIASDGKQLQSFKTNDDGSVSFSISDLPQGAYMIKSNSLTYKILKK